MSYGSGRLYVLKRTELLPDLKHPPETFDELKATVWMLESIPSASDAAWQSSADAILCSPLLSHVPDLTVLLSGLNWPAGHVI